MDVNRETFRKCAIVDSLMRGLPKLCDIDIEEIVNAIPIDSGLRNLIQTERARRINFNRVKQEVLEFSRNILRDLTLEERDAINTFYEEHIFEPDLIDTEKVLNKNIQNHSMIRRALEIL